MFIVDAGTYGLRNLALRGYPTGGVEADLLTHFHSDHIDGLGELSTIRWVSAANNSPLHVYGTQGVEQVVAGFNTSYALDMSNAEAGRLFGFAGGFQPIGNPAVPFDLGTVLPVWAGCTLIPEPFLLVLGNVDPAGHGGKPAHDL